MAEITPALLDAAFTSFDTIFQQNFKTVAPEWAKIAMLQPSTRSSLRHAWLDLIAGGGLREWVGERVVENISARTIEVTNRKFEKTISIDREKFEDDEIGVFAPAVGMLGVESAIWPDDLVVAALQAGVTTLTYDGQNFFDVAHPIDMDDPASATQSNNHTGTALTAANFQTVRSTMMSRKGRNNKPLSIRPNLLIVPPALEETALQILNAEFIAPAAAFGQNAAGGFQSNVLKGVADLFVWPRLAGQDTTWYVADVSKPVKPLIFQQRSAPEFQFLNRPTDPEVFMRDEYLFGVRARGEGAGALWQFIDRAIA